MIGKTIRQAWCEARQNPVFSWIYVAGVAMAIASTMLYALLNYVLIAPIYPEYNRDRTMYLVSAQGTINYTLEDGTTKTQTFGYALGYQLITDYLSKLENYEQMSVTKGLRYGEAKSETGHKEATVHWRPVDPAFFKIYDFEILAGRLITQEDFDSRQPVAVVGDLFAKSWWGEAGEAVGQTLHLESDNFKGKDFKVVGVVRQPSFLVNPGYTALTSYAQIYYPYTCDENYDMATIYGVPLLGPYSAEFLVKDHAQGEALKTEIDEMCHRIVAANDSAFQIGFYGTQPYWHVEAAIKDDPTDEFDTSAVFRRYGIIFMALLFVPALNLSGMIAGKMDGRLPEMGIRKSFGASRRKLLWQILVDNMVLTGLGAVAGLAVAYGLFYAFRSQLAYLFFPNPPELLDGEVVMISGDMLFNPTIFFGALGLCLALNVLAAIIPAALSLRRPIVNSINQKR